MTSTLEDMVNAFSVGRPGEDADYRIVGSRRLSCGHLAVSRDGSPSFIIPIAAVSAETTRLTHGLALRSAAALEFEGESKKWREPAAVIECRDAGLITTFAAMISAISARLASGARTWDRVVDLFSDWERLFGKRRLLTGESELGLWGELWTIAHSGLSDLLIAAWCGPERSHEDFLLGGVALEVKTSRRANSHVFSQKQVETTLEKRVLSLFAVADPVRGRSLSDLVEDVCTAVAERGMFEERLADTGYAREDDAAYHRKYAVAETPRLYPLDAIPRVRAVDPGISELRYRVELDPTRAMVDSILRTTEVTFGFDFTRLEYPCG